MLESETASLQLAAPWWAQSLSEIIPNPLRHRKSFLQGPVDGRCSTQGCWQRAVCAQNTGAQEFFLLPRNQELVTAWEWFSVRRPRALHPALSPLSQVPGHSPAFDRWVLNQCTASKEGP